MLTSGEWVYNVCQNPEAQNDLRQQATSQSLKEEAGPKFMALERLVSSLSCTIST